MYAECVPRPQLFLKVIILRYSAFSAELENSLMGTPRDTVYSRGKGAHKQKSEHCRLRKCDFKSEVCDAFSPLNDRDRECAFSAVFALSKTKKQCEFLKYQELTRIFLEISLKNKQ